MKANGKMHVYISGCLSSMQCFVYSASVLNYGLESLYICIRQEKRGVDNSGNDNNFV